MFPLSTATLVYKVLVTLRGVEPPVWRRIEIEDCSLSTLHRTIQAAMGWQDCHTHTFEIGDELRPGEEAGGELDLIGDDSIKLSQLVAAGRDCFNYTYDTGHAWDHTVTIEKSVPGRASARYPRCTGGKRACPPEGCGGVPGYEEFIRAICNPEHEQHSAMLAWVGGEFDPTAFDREEINRELRRVK